MLGPFTHALLTGDAELAWGLLDEAMTSSSTPERLAEEVIRPALHEVGEAWARASIGVADEHLATAICAGALLRMAERDPLAEPTGPTAVVACAEGEQHALAARMVADALARRGFRVLRLGSSTPSDALAELVAGRRAALLALSTTMPTGLVAAADAIRAVRGAAGAVGAAPLVAVGGQAYARARATHRDVGADLLLGSAASLGDEATARVA